MDPLTLIDMPTFLDLKDAMGSDYIEEMVDSYCQDASQLMTALIQAQQSGDAAAFTRLAHSIKSTSLTFGALAFGALARELEMLGREDRLGDTLEKVQQLQNACGPLHTALKELCHE
jgi:HPt (histidine-containing phosphotransfer) domain-containing protein